MMSINLNSQFVNLKCFPKVQNQISMYNFYLSYYLLIFENVQFQFDPVSANVDVKKNVFKWPEVTEYKPGDDTTRTMI